MFEANIRSLRSSQFKIRILMYARAEAFTIYNYKTISEKTKKQFIIQQNCPSTNKIHVINKV